MPPGNSQIFIPPGSLARCAGPPCRLTLHRKYLMLASSRLHPSAAKKGATRMPSKHRLAAIAVTAAGGFALAAPAGAQLLSHKDVSASIAIAIVQATIETCKTNGDAASATV